MPSFDEFLDDEMDGVDVHPVHDGNQSDGDRYKVVHKLGHGATSTEFAGSRSRDSKICCSEDQRIGPLQVTQRARYLQSSIQSQIQRLRWLELQHYIPSSEAHLRIYGYLALVLSVRGPSISHLYYWKIRLHPCIARSI